MDRDRKGKGKGKEKEKEKGSVSRREAQTGRRESTGRRDSLYSSRHDGRDSRGARSYDSGNIGYEGEDPESAEQSSYLQTATVDANAGPMYSVGYQPSPTSNPYGLFNRSSGEEESVSVPSYPAPSYSTPNYSMSGYVPAMYSTNDEPEALLSNQLTDLDLSRVETPALRQQSTAHVQRGDQVPDEELDARYVVIERGRRFFKVGRVFKVLWSEPAGRDGTELTDDERTSQSTKYGQKVWSKIRRFIVVREGHGHCTCLPLLTYGGQASMKRGVKPSDHAAVETEKTKAKYVHDERKKLGTKAFKILIEDSGEKLDPLTRINFAKIYTVEHNVRVCNIGRVVDKGELARLREHFLKVFLTNDIDSDLPPRQSSSDVPRLFTSQAFTPSWAAPATQTYSSQQPNAFAPIAMEQSPSAAATIDPRRQSSHSDPNGYVPAPNSYYVSDSYYPQASVAYQMPARYGDPQWPVYTSMYPSYPRPAMGTTVGRSEPQYGISVMDGEGPGEGEGEAEDEEQHHEW